MNKALFLDRDGVINIEKNYLYKISDFEFIDGVFETCLYFQSKNYKLIIITNQAGIAKGIYTDDDFHILNNWMLAEFKKKKFILTRFTTALIILNFLKTMIVENQTLILY